MEGQPQILEHLSESLPLTLHNTRLICTPRYSSLRLRDKSDLEAVRSHAQKASRVAALLSTVGT